MTPAERYWNALYEVIVHAYLLQAHCQTAADTDRKVRAGLAITSTSSLGIWAIFKVFPTFWAAIIVLTQVVSAVAKFLPYATRLKAAAACWHDYREIQNWAEAKWCEIADGELTEAQISKARTELKSKTSKAIKSHFPLDGLPKNEPLREESTRDAEKYIQHNFIGANVDGDQ